MSLPQQLVLKDQYAHWLRNLIKGEIELNYGLKVHIKELGQLENQLNETGTFDGFNINISDKVDATSRVFLLLHLFGHTDQCCSPSESELVNNFFNSTTIEYLEDYEFRSAEFSLELLHRCNIDTLDYWFKQFVNTDYLMVLRTYQHKKLISMSDCYNVLHIDFTPSTIPKDFKPKELGRVSVAF